MERLENPAAARRVHLDLHAYSRAIYRAVGRRVDPAGGRSARLDRRRAVLRACEEAMGRLAREPRFFGRPERALFEEIRHHFPLASQGFVAWAVTVGVGAAARYVEHQLANGAYEVVRRCPATTRRGKPCAREPHPGHTYCPVHKALEAAAA